MLLKRTVVLTRRRRLLRHITQDSNTRDTQNNRKHSNTDKNKTDTNSNNNNNTNKARNHNRNAKPNEYCDEDNNTHNNEETRQTNISIWLILTKSEAKPLTLASTISR